MRRLRHVKSEGCGGHTLDCANCDSWPRRSESEVRSTPQQSLLSLKYTDLGRLAGERLALGRLANGLACYVPRTKPGGASRHVT